MTLDQVCFKQWTNKVACVSVLTSRDLPPIPPKLTLSIPTPATAAGTDGTPNESSEEVFARVRQLLSITETQFKGEDIVLVAPDSDTLSILQVR